MAWRTTVDSVRAIVDTNPNLSMDVFVDTANALTDYVSSKDSEDVLTSALLIKIEENLAAHFYAFKDAQYQEKNTGKSSATYYGETGLGLDFTPWGQAAKTLDVSGTLVQLDSKPRPKASIDWLGLRPSEQTDFVDRN